MEVVDHWVELFVKNWFFALLLMSVLYGIIHMILRYICIMIHGWPPNEEIPDDEDD